MDHQTTLAKTANPRATRPRSSSAGCELSGSRIDIRLSSLQRPAAQVSEQNNVVLFLAVERLNLEANGFTDKGFKVRNVV
ncbi:MAG: hypothetical protein Marn2KO_08610 [Marinobacter nauticus]